MTGSGLSVVVPCFNAGIFICEACESIASVARGLDWEVIVIDDASTDQETGAALRSVSAMPNVRIERNSVNMGVQRSRNLGVSCSTKPFIMALDADDYLDPGGGDDKSFLALAVEHLEHENNVAFVQGMSKMCGAFDGLTISSYPVREDLVVRKHHVPTSIVYRRADVNLGATYDVGILKWQDWSFAVSLLATRWRHGLENEVAFVHGAHHRYRVHDKFTRVSQRDVSEYQMVLRTVEIYLDYFSRFHAGATDVEEIAKRVLKGKPSIVEDLLFMAAFDLEQALQVVREREFTLASPFTKLGIP